MTYNRFIQGLQGRRGRGRPQDPRRAGRERRGRVRRARSRLATGERARPGRDRGLSTRLAEHLEPPGTERTPRVVAARKLLRRAGRERAGRFLVEGAQAVREALTAASGPPCTSCSSPRRPPRGTPSWSRGRRGRPGRRRSPTGRRRLLSDTVTPQGLVAVCDLLDVPVAARSPDRPRLVAVLVGVADPGNAGTVIRVADAAGADAVLLAGDARRPAQRQVRAGLAPAACSTCRSPATATPPPCSTPAAPPGCDLLAADGRGELDLRRPRRRRRAGRPDGLAVRQRGARPPAEISPRPPTTGSRSRSTAGRRASTWPPRPRSASTPAPRHSARRRGNGRAPPRR